MASLVHFLIIFILSSGLLGILTEDTFFLPPVSETQIEIDTVFDSSELPDHYRARITTPICEADKCYAVEIIFYWDLIGRYLRYDTIPGAGLTKLDHQPFQPQDFNKLGEILANDNSILASYEKEELVRDNRISEIDGFTGATVAEIKENVIEGAVYSCYTLWHIAHGTATEKVKEITSSMLDKELVKKLVDMEDQAINYFLINQLSSEDFIKYRPEILQTLNVKEGYYAKNAIEKIPASFFTDTLAQSYFALNFNELNYYAQVALLEKLQEIELNSVLMDTIAKQSNDKNTRKDELVDYLLLKNEE